MTNPPRPETLEELRTRALDLFAQDEACSLVVDLIGEAYAAGQASLLAASVEGVDAQRAADLPPLMLVVPYVLAQRLAAERDTLKTDMEAAYDRIRDLKARQAVSDEARNDLGQFVALVKEDPEVPSLASQLRAKQDECRDLRAQYEEAREDANVQRARAERAEAGPERCTHPALTDPRRSLEETIGNLRSDLKSIRDLAAAALGAPHA